MKYFIDFEFIEGFNKPVFGKRRHFIDLISVGIVAEDGREYYAISNEFNPKDADEWVKENVIDKIQLELYRQESTYAKTYHSESLSLKNLLKWRGKSNYKISQEIISFLMDGETTQPMGLGNPYVPVAEFYGYYADYDWVLLCSLFGRMVDLPTGFPMYCRDLKQMFDETEESLNAEARKDSAIVFNLKDHEDYPKQADEHNAIADAKWNKQLYGFLQLQKQP